MILLAAEGLSDDEIASTLAWLGGAPQARPFLGFFPEVIVHAKAIACELPSKRGWPLSSLSSADIVREVQKCGIFASINDKTVWRWLK